MDIPWCAIVATLLIGLPGAVSADENRLFTPDYLRRVGRDVGDLPGAVRHWSPGAWALAGSLTVATVGALHFDGAARQSFGRQRPHDLFNDFSRSYTHFGDYRYLAPLIGGAWIGGLATGSRTLDRVAADSAEATFISAGLINPTLAFATGRALPSAGENPGRFRPFSRGRYSFPSGHTSAAFAVASSIDVDLRERFGYWQTPLLYGVAALVGTSRVYDHKHYPSEVILGATIGTAIGRWVALRPRNGTPADLSLGVGPREVRFTWRFGGSDRGS